MRQVGTSAVIVPTTLSAKGTRLNRRGLATRGRILRVAVELLSNGGPDTVSANLIAREAGVTWGTIQHQFGEADGVWAAVIEHVSTQQDFLLDTDHLATLALPARLEAIVGQVWAWLDWPSSRAVRTLRLYLPRDMASLERDFPRTAAALTAWDIQWTAAWDLAFDGLDVSRERLVKVRSLIPATVRGLHDINDDGGYTDIALARAALIEAMTLYLSRDTGDGVPR
ncbi:TetR/AcrR family transcriptional regulator [Frankia sp. CNm7]|uniref:TetR/AcrR family transcriptional regulator n=1 Tax=Frankia nepalensis TaxID=1836974 RepID=A0A937RED5_9ACTN|nr:TetR/AcrR family transcriptional regulator [Frankia nepalensis]MBL7499106.1 TetR/AcrR family transcriptional regulator [Frankia nepalensis]MBL7513881.1 TetR/AcrR family transcriptional regulator [Frankia nepalensis]MBL7523163.1 TetR/AcrR family transcriptional regulator [Frankia nepalensis]MBL7625899.1 TetR/AcrR family transcriptional regulator [Frankia nepalensis]